MHCQRCHDRVGPPQEPARRHSILPRTRTARQTYKRNDTATHTDRTDVKWALPRPLDFTRGGPSTHTLADLWYQPRRKPSTAAIPTRLDTGRDFKRFTVPRRAGQPRWPTGITNRPPGTGKRHRSLAEPGHEQFPDHSAGPARQPQPHRPLPGPRQAHAQQGPCACPRPVYTPGITDESAPDLPPKRQKPLSVAVRGGADHAELGDRITHNDIERAFCLGSATHRPQHLCLTALKTGSQHCPARAGRHAGWSKVQFHPVSGIETVERADPLHSCCISATKRQTVALRRNPKR